MSKRSPRLQFTDEELSTPEMKNAVEKTQKQSDKLDKAEAQIPKKTIISKERTVDTQTGKVTTKLSFEKVDKKTPSKLTHSVAAAPINTALSSAHREIRESEDDNVGVESAHKIEEAAEGGVRTVESAHRSHQMKPYRNASRAEIKADKANLTALNRQARIQNPELSSNPYSRWQQKRAIKKQYAAANAGQGTSGTVNASEITAKAAEQTVERTKKVNEFIVKHKKDFLIILGLLLLAVFLLNVASSCSVLIEGSVTAVSVSTYPSEDSDMLAAEDEYLALEAELQSKLDNYESTHDYDEYHYELDDIEHDPYVLISTITALQGGAWTIDQVGGVIQSLFDQQYTLTETVVHEVRYRTETDSWTDEDGNTHTDTYQVPYDYYICTVTLENFDLSHLPVYIMSEDQLSMYSIYMATLGNRPDLFSDSDYVSKYYDTDYGSYEVPPEALEDETFAAMIAEAEKYLGYPYVWGGSSPSTSFDCSGFVSWVINHSGWNVGRLGANGLRNICTQVSPSEAKPGDLIFFEKTYNTTGASHVGIYVGNNTMIHCGDPIQYTRIDTNYWQEHFLSFGRLP
jgi:cell wall-associated NlpC family hydrolase